MAKVSGVSMDSPWGIVPGDQVYTADGHRLGEVVLADTHEFVVESGYLFRHNYVLTVDEIARQDGSVLTSTLTMDELKARERR